MLTKSCLVVLIGGIMLLSLFGLSFANNSDEAYYQVFAKGALGPHKTLDLIRDLVEQYQGHEDSVSKERRDKLAHLVEVSKFSKENCNRGYVDKMDQLIEQYGAYQHNLVPYLNANLDAQMEYCLDDWNELSARWKELFDPYNTHYREAIEVLKKLKALKNEFDIESSPILKTRMDRTASLIELSVINEEKCNEETTRTYRELIKSLGKAPDMSLQHYAIDFYTKLSNFCEEKGKVV